MSKSFYTIMVFARLSTRRFFRDRLAIFFVIIFPIIFLFVFGGIFGHDSNPSFRVALINQSDSRFAGTFASQLKSNKAFKIDPKVNTLEAAKEKMTRGQLDAAIVLPEGFGTTMAMAAHPAGQAKVYYTQNNATAGQTLTALLDGLFKGINAQFTGTPMPFSVEGIATTDKRLRAFDYTFAGLLGFSILGLGIFGPANFFPELKKQGVLRRLHTTPLKVWQYFVSTALSQAVVGLVAMAVLFVVAMLVFHLKVVGNYLEIALWLVLGIVMILGIGLAIGGWARNERQAQPLANLLTFPMMFLAGTFFPRFLMPEWLQTVSNYLPLTPVIDGIRLIATEGKTLIDLGPQLGLIVGWLIVVYLIAFRVFRWE